MKIRFLKAIRYKNDAGIMRSSKAWEIVDFFDEERAEDVLYDGFAVLIPEHFPSSAKYLIQGPWPVKIDGQAINPETVVTLDAETASELCSKRQAVPIDEGLWCPGRGSSSKEATKLYTEGEE